MSITPEEVKKIAKLARLSVTDEQCETWAPDLNNILGFVEQLNDLDTYNVEPLASVSEIDTPMREDKVTDGNIQQDVLKNAAESLEGYYVVPKVVE